MNGKKPDRTEIKITQLGDRVLDRGIIEEEIAADYLGDEEGEGDVFITRKLRGQPDCGHAWAEPYAVCACGRMVYCKVCYYHLGVVRCCERGHLVGPCCYRKSYLFSGRLVCRICGAYLLDPSKPPERKE